MEKNVEITNSDQWWNNNKRLFQCKKHNICGQDNISNPATFSCENGKYLSSIMDDSAITCRIIRWRNKNYSNKFW